MSYYYHTDLLPVIEPNDGKGVKFTSTSRNFPFGGWLVHDADNSLLSSNPGVLINETAVAADSKFPFPLEQTSLVQLGTIPFNSGLIPVFDIPSSRHHPETRDGGDPDHSDSYPVLTRATLPIPRVPRKIFGNEPVTNRKSVRVKVYGKGRVTSLKGQEQELLETHFTGLPLSSLEITPSQPGSSIILPTPQKVRRGDAGPSKPYPIEISGDVTEEKKVSSSGLTRTKVTLTDSHSRKEPVRAPLLVSLSQQKYSPRVPTLRVERIRTTTDSTKELILEDSRPRSLEHPPIFNQTYGSSILLPKIAQVRRGEVGQSKPYPVEIEEDNHSEIQVESQEYRPRGLIPTKLTPRVPNLFNFYRSQHDIFPPEEVEIEFGKVPVPFVAPRSLTPQTVEPLVRIGEENLPRYPTHQLGSIRAKSPEKIEKKQPFVYVMQQSIQPIDPNYDEHLSSNLSFRLERNHTHKTSLQKPVETIVSRLWEHKEEEKVSFIERYKLEDTEEKKVPFINTSAVDVPVPVTKKNVTYVWEDDKEEEKVPFTYTPPVEVLSPTIGKKTPLFPLPNKKEFVKRVPRRQTSSFKELLHEKPPEPVVRPSVVQEPIKFDPETEQFLTFYGTLSPAERKRIRFVDDPTAKHFSAYSTPLKKSTTGDLTPERYQPKFEKPVLLTRGNKRQKENQENLRAGPPRKQRKLTRVPLGSVLNIL
jgi:hypothetical protein